MPERRKILSENTGKGFSDFFVQNQGFFSFLIVWKEIKVSYRDSKHFILKIHLNEIFLFLKATTY